MNRTSIKQLGSAILLLAVSLPASADLIVNGGFEADQRKANTWGLYESIVGWTRHSGGRIEIQNRVAGSPYEGNQHVELDSTQPSAIAQAIATVVGQTYRLSFAFAGRPRTNLALDNVLSVMWGDSEIFNQAARTRTNNWQVFSFDVTATSALTTLVFRDASKNSRNSYGVYIDDVSLVQIPEPGTLALLGLGLLGLGLRRRV